MIKLENIHMLDRAVVNPRLTAQTETANHNIITDSKGEVYLLYNECAGDESRRQNNTFPAGEPLTGYLLKSLAGQKLVIDGKHIDGGINSIAVGDVLTVKGDGTLEVGEITSGCVYFVVTDIAATLTERAVKAKIAFDTSVAAANTIDPASVTYDLNELGANHENKSFTITPPAEGVTITGLIDDEGDPIPDEFTNITAWSLDETGLVITLTTAVLDAIGLGAIETTDSITLYVKMSDDSTVGITINFENTAENVIMPKSITFDINEDGANHGGKSFVIKPVTPGVTVSKLYMQEGETPDPETDMDAPQSAGDVTLWSTSEAPDHSSIILELSDRIFDNIPAGTYSFYALLSDDSTAGIFATVEDTTQHTPVPTVQNQIDPTNAIYDLNVNGANHEDKQFTVTPAIYGETIVDLLDDEGDSIPPMPHEPHTWSVRSDGVTLVLLTPLLDTMGNGVINEGAKTVFTVKLSDDSTVDLTINFEDTSD